MKTKKPFDIYQTVTDKIVAALEQGVVPWSRPWESGLTEPINGVSKKPYRGMNVFLLWIEQMTKQYEHPIWLSYKQASDLGANVRKGEKSTMVVFWQIGKRLVTNEAGKTEEKKSFLLRYYNVFNIAQIENLPDTFMAKFTAKVLPGMGNKLTAEYKAFVKATGAVIKHGGARAFYTINRDYIQMPKLEQFKTADDYAATELHELTHWTGHKDRLAREFGKRFGDDAYAIEELVAEMGSAFLCTHLGIRGSNIESHASYLATWLKVLKADKKAIMTASSKAAQAADFVRKASQPEDEEPADGEALALAA